MALKNIRILHLGFLCSMLFNLSDAWASRPVGLPTSDGAERQDTIRPLQTGDTIPEKLWSLPLKVVNHPDGKDTITLSDYRDKKLIILDFWATWCVPCIGALDNMGSIIGNIPGAEDIGFLPATYEDARKGANMISLKGWRFCSVVENSTLKSYFPHTTVPHVVWISEGKLLALSESDYLTRENIENVLGGVRVDFGLDISPLKIEPGRPLLLDIYEQRAGSVIFQSLLTRYIAGLDNNWRKNQEGRSLLYINSTIASLLAKAYYDRIPFEGYTKRLVFSTSDEIKHKITMPDFGPDKAAKNRWFRENAYCYNVVFESGNAHEKDLYEQMIRDINLFLSQNWHVQSTVETREVSCLVLEVIGEDMPASSGDAPLYKRETDRIIYRNLPPKNFINGLIMANPSLEVPIVDGTGISHTIDVAVPSLDVSSPGALQDVNDILSGYGLCLTEKPYPTEMIIFYETK